MCVVVDVDGCGVGVEVGVEVGVDVSVEVGMAVEVSVGGCWCGSGCVAPTMVPNVSFLNCCYPTAYSYSIHTPPH